ncbi:MAG: hypothetical protein E2P06_01190 [Acidobacteria bacterium]|nr:MAG: hypothetical protein E2P06_01190 [Acidobacteriota bacterium]
MEMEIFDNENRKMLVTLKEFGDSVILQIGESGDGRRAKRAFSTERRARLVAYALLSSAEHVAQKKSN